MTSRQLVMLLGLATVWGGGVFLGWLALKEPLGWHLAAALALIISGLALVQNVLLRGLPRSAYRRLPFVSSPVEP